MIKSIIACIASFGPWRVASKAHRGVPEPPAQLKLVTVCGWCPDAREQTDSARANGFDVTHGICAACQRKMDEQAASRYEQSAKKEQEP